MELVILAFDWTWKKVYELALAAGKNEIKVCFPGDFKEDAGSLEMAEDSSLDASRSHLVIASAEPLVRREVFETWKKKGFSFESLVHPVQYVDKTTKYGEGTLIFGGVIVYPDSVIGDNCLLMEYSSVSHDSRIGSHTVLMEKYTQGGYGTVGECVKMGQGSVTRERISVGSFAEILPGSCVLSDVKEHAVVCGNPARERKNR